MADEKDKEGQAAETAAEEVFPQSMLDEIDRISKERRFTKEQKEKFVERAEVEYLKSKFEPGEVIGIIAAQSISEPATQMSLPYEEKILIKKDGIISPLKIGSFVDELMGKFGSKVESGNEVLDLPKDLNFYVYSIDGQDEKLKLKRVKSVIRHKSPKMLLKIKTASGRRIMATDHHSFVVRRNNRLVPIAGSSLKVNDRIPAIKKLPENCISTISIGSMMPSGSLVRKDGLVFPYVAHSKGLPDELQLDHLLGWFIGAYLSEGNHTRSFVNISNTNEEFNGMVRSFASKFGLTVNEYDNFRGFSKGHDLHINSTLLSRFLKEACGSISRDKKVPFFAFSAEEKFVRALLQSYFDGDGSISIDRKGIRASSESKELLDGIALLLSRFGIFCSKSDDGRSIWIPCKYAQVFHEKISSSIEKRREMMRRLGETYSKTEKRAELTDMIPGIGDILFETAKKLKYPTRFVNNFTKRQKIGRATLGKYVSLFESMAKQKGIDVSSEIEILKKPLNSDVVWDRIEEISYVDSESEYVYDVSVDGLETFATFDGIITHNTMRTYHFAGSVGIKVTYGLPRLIEIFDAKREPETPVMTLFLKREYNNMDDAKKVAEDIIEESVTDISKRIAINLADNSIEIELEDMRKSGTVEAAVKEALAGAKEIEKIRASSKGVTITAKEDVEIKELQKVREKIMLVHVGGLRNISNAVIRREGEDWVISTIGSNLAEVLKIKEVDDTRTYTNDLHETKQILGIEAARNLIISESFTTLQEQGLDVDLRHLMLVGDIMTMSGDIRSIGRYGVAGTKSSILARAAFEETIKHLVRASIRGEVDNFEGIFENVMIGQLIPSGTGMFELIAKFEDVKPEEAESE